MRCTAGFSVQLCRVSVIFTESTPLATDAAYPLRSNRFGSQTPEVQRDRSEKGEHGAAARAVDASSPVRAAA